jgi:hypothetical protein
MRLAIAAIGTQQIPSDWFRLRSPSARNVGIFA